MGSIRITNGHGGAVNSTSYAPPSPAPALKLATPTAARPDRSQVSDVNPYQGFADRTATVKVDGWRKGPNDSIEGILRNQGYSLPEIYNKDASGLSPLERVAQANGLKDPNLVPTGKTLLVPSKKAPKPHPDIRKGAELMTQRSSAPAAQAEPAPSTRHFQSADMRKGGERMMQHPAHPTKAQPEVQRAQPAPTIQAAAPPVHTPKAQPEVRRAQPEPEVRRALPVPEPIVPSKQAPVHPAPPVHPTKAQPEVRRAQPVPEPEIRRALPVPEPAHPVHPTKAQPEVRQAPQRPRFSPVDTRKGGERMMQHFPPTRPQPEPRRTPPADPHKGGVAATQRPAQTPPAPAPPNLATEARKADSVEVGMLIDGVKKSHFTRTEFQALNSTANQFTELRAKAAKHGFPAQENQRLSQIQQAYGQMYARFQADDKAQISFQGSNDKSASARFHTAQNEEGGRLYDEFKSGHLGEQALKADLLAQRETASQRGLEFDDQIKRRSWLYRAFHHKH